MLAQECIGFTLLIALVWSNDILNSRTTVFCIDVGGKTLHASFTWANLSWHQGSSCSPLLRMLSTQPAPAAAVVAIAVVHPWPMDWQYMGRYCHNDMLG
jgi:hypothetical protein